jgi:hypothetical protein
MASSHRRAALRIGAERPARNAPGTILERLFWVGIERSSPTQGNYFKKEKNFGFRKKSDPKKLFFDFLRKKLMFREPGSMLPGIPRRA